MQFIGIDPGKNGGIAFIDEPHVLVYKLSSSCLIQTLTSASIFTPNGYQLRNKTNVKFFIENVQGFPGRSAATAIAQGKSWGELIGILKVFDIVPIIVQPSTWKKEFDLLRPKLAYKEKKLLDIQRAKELFPGVNLIPERSKVEHDGMADALLIAEYGRRKYESEMMEK